MPVQASEAYLELLKQSLTRAYAIRESRSAGRRRRGLALVFDAITRRGHMIVPAVASVAGRTVRSVPGLLGSSVLVRLLARRDLAIIPNTDPGPVGPAPARLVVDGHCRLCGGLDQRLAGVEREFGLDWPEHAETMVGLRRLTNLQQCVSAALAQGVPGDLIEAGVWRGGTAILMRGVLAAHGDEERCVWVADSFAGLPKPRPEEYPFDAGLDYTGFAELSVSLDQVRANFARYHLLDDRVRFLPGWFSETLPGAPIEQIAVMRLDGDLYESTIDALTALYPRLSIGGYCIVDDFGAIPACRRAVEDYRRTHGITEAIQTARDWTAVYWQRERPQPDSLAGSGQP